MIFFANQRNNNGLLSVVCSIKTKVMKNKLKIFIVEDDPIYSSILESNLKNQPDLIVYSYTSAEDMLGNLHLNPDVVLLDFYLETMNGIDALKGIIGFNPNISVLFISGQDKTDVAVDCLKFGAMDYIVKDEDSIKKLMGLLDKIRAHRNEIRKQKRQFRIKTIVLTSLLILTVFILSIII